MNKRFNPAKVLVFALALALILPSISVFAKPGWGDKGHGFHDKNSSFTLNILTYFSEGDVEADRYIAITSANHPIKAETFNTFVDGEPDNNFVDNKTFNYEKFINALIKCFIHEGTNFTQNILNESGNHGNLAIKDRHVDFANFEIPAAWKLYLGEKGDDLVQNQYKDLLNNPAGDIEEAFLINVAYIAVENKDDLLVDKLKTYNHADGEKDQDPPPQPQPQPQPQPEPKSEEPEESKEPPVTIRPDGVPGSYYISPEISGPPAVPAKDPHFVKVIVVDKNTLKVLPTTNHWLPRRDEMSALANSFFGSEQSYGNLPGYAFAGLITEEEAVNSPALQAIMALYDAEYIILVG